MAGKRKNPLWRQTFLRALARSGNVRASAFEAGVDPGTAYDHRAKDARFAGKWAGALAKARNRPSPRPSPRSGRGGSGELVLRRSKLHGDQMIRAGAGRWNAAAEEIFFAALGRTGCVRAAARACGFSANALYKRREAYPEFAEQWRAVEAEGLTRLPDLLRAASIASLDPEVEGRGLPRVNVDQAIAISRLKSGGGDGRPALGGRGIRPRVATNAEVRAALTERLAAFRKRVRAERVAEGWTETAEGCLIPPGWVYVGKAGEGGCDPEGTNG